MNYSQIVTLMLALCKNVTFFAIGLYHFPAVERLQKPVKQKAITKV